MLDTLEEYGGAVRGWGTVEKMPGLVSVLVIYYFLTNYLQIEGLKPTNMYYLIVSVARNLDTVWLDASGSRYLTRLQSVAQGCGWRLHWGRIRFQVHPHASGQDSVPWGLLDWGLCFFAGYRLEASLSSLPWHLSIGQLPAPLLSPYFLCQKRVSRSSAHSRGRGAFSEAAYRRQVAILLFSLFYSLVAILERIC